MIQRRADYAAGAEIVRRTYGGAAPSTRSAPPRAHAINLRTVEMLERPHFFRYRDRLYVIGRIDWFDGLLLEYHMEEIKRLLGSPVTQEARDRLVDHYLDAFALFWRNVQPFNPILRWLRRWHLLRANPFLTMTNVEFGAVSSFYSECRMQLSSRALAIMPDRAPENPPPSTLQTPRHNSYRRSLHGRMRAGVR